MGFIHFGYMYLQSFGSTDLTHIFNIYLRSSYLNYDIETNDRLCGRYQKGCDYKRHFPRTFYRKYRFVVRINRVYNNNYNYCHVLYFRKLVFKGLCTPKHAIIILLIRQKCNQWFLTSHLTPRHLNTATFSHKKRCV